MDCSSEVEGYASAGARARQNAGVAREGRKSGEGQ
jgi:hypothetical protein